MDVLTFSRMTYRVMSDSHQVPEDELPAVNILPNILGRREKEKRDPVVLGGRSALVNAEIGTNKGLRLKTFM